MPTENFENKFTHTIVGLGGVKNMQKLYEKVSNTNRQLAKSAGEVAKKFRNVSVFKGYDAAGRKVSKTLTEIDGKLKSVKTVIDASDKSGKREVETLKRLTKEGDVLSRTLTKVRGKVVNVTTSIDKLRNAQRTVEVFRKFDKEGRRVTETVTKLAGRIIRTKRTVDELNNAIRKTTTLTKFDKQGRRWIVTYTKVGDRLVAVKRRMAELRQPIQRVTQSAEKQNKVAQRLAITWGSVGRIILGSLVSRAVAELTNAFRDSIFDASEFLVKIGEVRTISQNAQLSTDEWTESIRRLSDQFATPIVDVAEGAYQALSNQIAEGAETTKFLAEAQRLALISVATTDEAVLALTGTLNAYNLGADEARNVSNAFFKTIELGRLRLSDIADSIGRVNILGANLGVTYQEVDAALATLTIQGVNAAEGMTFLRNVFLKLIRPTKQMREFFTDIGVASGAAAIETFGFQGVLRLLAERAENAADPMDELGAIFGRIRSILGGVGLINAIERFDDNLQEITKAAESSEEALRIMQDNLGFRFRKELNKTSNFFKVEIGTKLVKTFVNLNEQLGGATNALRKAFQLLTNAAELLTVAITLKLTKALGTYIITSNLATAASGRLAAGLAFTGVSARAVTAINLLTASVAGLSKAFLAVLPLAVAFGTFKIVSFFLKGVGDIEKATGSLSQDFIDASNVRTQKYKEEMDSLVKGTVNAVDAARQKFQQLSASVASTTNKLNMLAEAQAEFNKETNKQRFDILLKSGQVEQARSLALKQLRDARKDLVELASKDNITKADIETFEEIEKRARAAVSVLSEVKDKEIEIVKENQKKIDAGTANLDILRRQQDILGRGGIRGFFIKNKEREVLLGKELLNLEKQLLSVRERFGRQIAQGRNQSGFRRPDLTEAILGREKGTKAVIQLLKDLSTEIKNTGSEANESQKFIENFFLQISQLGADLNAQFSGFNRNFVPENLLKSINVLAEAGSKPATLENAQKVAEALRILVEGFKGTELIGGEEGTLFGDLERRLVGINDAIAGDFVKRLESFSTVLNRVRTSFKEIEQARTKRDSIATTLNVDVKAIDKTINEMILNIEQLPSKFEKMANAGELSAKTIIQEYDRVFIEVIKVVSQVQKALADAERAAKEAQAANNFIQQIIQNPFNILRTPQAQPARRQTGGPVGRDSQLAMFDPREFIMSAKATSKFLPQLIAMNSGSKRFETGGPVTNNNVGDINVNVTASGDTNVDARALGAALRRELRRNTIRLS